MSLSSIAADIKDAVGQGQQWLAKAVEEHVPALVAEAERIQGSVIFQALEGLVLPPEVEAEIVNVIKAFARLVPAPSAPVAVPAESSVSTEPAPPGPEVPAEPSAA